MRPYRLLVAALLLLALAGAGCTSREPGAKTVPPPSPEGLVPVGGGSGGKAGADGNGTAKARPSPATLNLTRDPVDIQDGGDLTNGTSRDWSWHVAPGFATFTVEVRLRGLQGAPAFAVADLRLRLEGGDPSGTVIDTGGFFAGSDSCTACLDGADLDSPAGQWTLHLSTAPSAAQYSVHVVVAY